MDFELCVWRQKNRDEPGRFDTYAVTEIEPDMSFLEMLDVANEQLADRGLEPIAFDYDCREGICGSCSLMINGEAHGPLTGATTCQTYMRHFADGQQLLIEPWRAAAFPVVRDLVVDRSALDAVIEAGGFVSVKSGSAPDANAVPVPKEEAEIAFDAAQCIGCGACVAACPNSSAMLFVAAKAAHLAHLPQGAPERLKRAVTMIEAHDREGFGSCGNHYRCEAACPKEISIRYIAELNRDFIRAALTTDQLSKLPPKLDIEE
jgi:succinate dehydrogenase / fumarate reductase, iron-sulfur subunit